VEVHDEQAAPVALEWAHRLGSVVSLFGGFATVLVAVGYIYNYAFFRTIGAGWLARELSLGEITFGSMPPLLLLFSYALIAQFLPGLFRSRWVSFGSTPIARAKVAGAMVIVGLIINVLILNSRLKTVMILQPPGGLLLVGMVLLAFGSALMALSMVDAARSPLLTDRERAPWLALWFALLGLVITPAMNGVFGARIRLNSPADFSCAVVVNGQVERCLPIIYVGSERLIV
jgi:hypothetical protein